MSVHLFKINCSAMFVAAVAIWATVGQPRRPTLNHAAGNMAQHLAEGTPAVKMEPARPMQRLSLRTAANLPRRSR